MPIYEFSCPDCGAEFEMKRSFSDTSMPACPKCAGGNVQRLLSRPAIHFKGSGWYITDSKNNTKASATGSSGSSDGDAAKSTETKPAESKPAETKTADSSEKTAKPAESAAA